MTTELARHQPEESAIQQIDVANLLQQIIKAGVTSDAAAAVKELVMLAEHREDRNAKQQWMQAFARVRGKMKTVKAEYPVPDKNGNVRWWVSSLPDIQDAVEPILESEDMYSRWDTRREDKFCIGICIIGCTNGGHEERSEFAVIAANAQGGDVGAATTAKRGAVIAMLGIKIRHATDDAAILGDYITQGQADALRARAVALGGDWPDRIMRYINKLGFEDYPKIRQGKYATVDEGIRKAENKIFADGSKLSPATVERFYEQKTSPTGATAPHGGAPVPKSQAKGEVESKAAGVIETAPAAGPATSPPSDGAPSKEDQAHDYAESMAIADLRRTLQGASVGSKAIREAYDFARNFVESDKGPLPRLVSDFSDEQIRSVAEMFRLQQLLKGK